MACGEIHELRWDAVNYQVQVRYAEDAVPAGQDGTTHRPRERIWTRSLPVQQVVRWSQRLVHFYPDGSAETAWIELENSHGHRKRIEIIESRIIMDTVDPR